MEDDNMAYWYDKVTKPNDNTKDDKLENTDNNMAYWYDKVTKPNVNTTKTTK
jgi:hypothetical protein